MENYVCNPTHGIAGHYPYPTKLTFFTRLLLIFQRTVCSSYAVHTASYRWLSLAGGEFICSSSGRESRTCRREIEREGGREGGREVIHVQMYTDPELKVENTHSQRNHSLTD